MDQQTYAQHMRRVFLNEAMQQIMDLPDDKVMSMTFDRAREIDPKFKQTDFDKILREGTDEHEVDEMFGLSLDDPKEDMEAAPEMSGEALESMVTESFGEVVQLFLDRPGAACLISFSYFDNDITDGDVNSAPLRGHQLAFGDAEAVDDMLEVLVEAVEESTQDGYVDTLNAHEDADDELLGGISLGML